MKGGAIMRTAFKRIFVVAFILLLGACAYPRYDSGPPRLSPALDKKLSNSECVLEFGNRVGAEVLCKNTVKLTMQESTELTEWTLKYERYLLQQSGLGYNNDYNGFLTIRSGYPHVITRGRYDRRLYGGPKYTHRLYESGTIHQSWGISTSRRW
ncbi:hypothetical protein HYW58_02335 [Candidatus Kaiserbacteria bacterium]|nr:hypothetical protein [Candidatus Kaiserbacteria bacterium]